MKTFDLKTWMTENRDQVISGYNELKEQTHFNNCTMRQFGIDVYQYMVANNPRSEKTATKCLVNAISKTIVENSCITGDDWLIAKMERMYGKNSIQVAMV